MKEKKYYSVEVIRIEKSEIQYIADIEWTQGGADGRPVVKSVALTDRFIHGWVLLTWAEVIQLRRYLAESGLFKKMYESHEPTIGLVELFGAFTAYDVPERGVTMEIHNWRPDIEGPAAAGDAGKV